MYINIQNRLQEMVYSKKKKLIVNLPSIRVPPTYTRSQFLDCCWSLRSFSGEVSFGVSPWPNIHRIRYVIDIRTSQPKRPPPLDGNVQLKNPLDSPKERKDHSSIWKKMQRAFLFEKCRDFPPSKGREPIIYKTQISLLPHRRCRDPSYKAEITLPKAW